MWPPSGGLPFAALGTWFGPRAAPPSASTELEGEPGGSRPQPAPTARPGAPTLQPRSPARPPREPQTRLPWGSQGFLRRPQRYPKTGSASWWVLSPKAQPSQRAGEEGCVTACGNKENTRDRSGTRTRIHASPRTHTCVDACVGTHAGGLRTWSKCSWCLDATACSAVATGHWAATITTHQSPHELTCTSLRQGLGSLTLGRF